MDSFSLLTTPWLPVRLKDGSTGKLAPVNLADENVVDIAAARADLQGAAWQFLLGLLQCSMAPKNHSRWEDVWFEGLSADVLQRALEPLEPAFQFGADTPSFMQDFEALTGEKVSIASLLPETPGAQTIKLIKTTLLSAASRSDFVRTARRWRYSRYSLMLHQVAKDIALDCVTVVL